MPFLSIIIPTFNSASTLRRTLESVLCQVYTDFEILVIDGNSSDNTIEILKEYQNQCIKFITEPDKGIYDAMNKGINMAKGQWIYFLGSDDKLYDHLVLEEIARVANNSDHDVIYGNVLISGSTSWAKDAAVYDGEFDLKKLIRKNICHQSIFYKTKFIKRQIGYYNLDYNICSDWDFNLRCWAKTTFFYLNKIIAEFSGGGESSRNTVDDNFQNDFVNNIITCFNISVFDPLVNNPEWWFYPDILVLQKRQNYFRYVANRIKRKSQYLLTICLKSLDR
jgi:glycosyltransferase involved in cell wall biosynthesis